MEELKGNVVKKMKKVRENEEKVSRRNEGKWGSVSRGSEGEMRVGRARVCEESESSKTKKREGRIIEG